jgi:hypothetical protein
MVQYSPDQGDGKEEGKGFVLPVLPLSRDLSHGREGCIEEVVQPI